MCTAAETVIFQRSLGLLLLVDTRSCRSSIVCSAPKSGASVSHRPGTLRSMLPRAAGKSRRVFAVPNACSSNNDTAFGRAGLLPTAAPLR